MSYPESGLLGEKNKNKYIPLASGWNTYSHLLANGKTPLYSIWKYNEVLGYNSQRGLQCLLNPVSQ